MNSVILSDIDISDYFPTFQDWMKKNLFCHMLASIKGKSRQTLIY